MADIKSGSSMVEKMSEYDIMCLESEFLKRYYHSRSGKKRPFIQILKMCRGYYGKLVIAAIFCVLQLSASLYIPIATANVIDALTRGGDDTAKTIIVNLSTSAFLLLINYPCQRIYLKLRDDVAVSIGATLRGAIVFKLQHLTMQFNKEMESGRIQSKIMTDVASITSLISNLFTSGIHIVVNLTTVLFVLVAKGNFEVLAFFAVCGPAAAFITKLFRGPIREKSNYSRRMNENTNARVNDMVNLVPITKAHGLEDVEINKLNNQFVRQAKANYELNVVLTRFTVVSWLLMQVFQMLCLAFTVFWAFNGKLSVGDVTLYQSYFANVVSYINSIMNLVPVLASGFAAVSSVDEILGSNDVEENRNKKSVVPLKGEYIIKNGGFKYRDGDKKILDGLNLTVNAGETVALVGESGSGKTTIVNLVIGFDFLTEGTLTVDGTDIKNIDLNDYRQQLAVVPQNSILFSGTIRENITYGSKNISEERLKEILELSCLTDVINNLPAGLDTQIGEMGNKLSGGQRQRISIARALIRDPRVIIFDEATSALDTVSEKHIQTAIDNLSKDRTTFIVAHRLSTIKNADKIAVIKEGKCVEFGTYDELLEKKGEFYNFRSLQV